MKVGTNFKFTIINFHKIFMEQTQIPQEVRTFLEGLLQDAGMTFADNQMKEEMVKEVYARLDSYIASVVVDKLQPADFEVFIKMNDEKKSKEEIEAFLKEKVPDSQNIFAKAFADFRQMYLGNVTVARNTPEPTDSSKPN